MGGAEPLSDQQGHLPDDARMTFGQRADHVLRNARHHGRLRGLCRRGIRAPLDDGHAAECFAGAKELEDDVLPAPGVTEDLHATALDEAERDGRLALVKHVIARAIGHVAGGRGERREIVRGETFEERVPADDVNVLGRHRAPS